MHIEKPVGFETHDMWNHVCKLKKCLYGLKHTPKTWYRNMDKFLMIIGFTKSKEDSNLSFKVEGGIPMTLSVKC